jgi:hypothetical protein
MEFNFLSLVANGGWMAVASVLAYAMIRLDKSLRSIDREQTAMRDRIASVEKEYVCRSEYYRDISGWRGDIRGLEQSIADVRNDFAYYKGRNERGE